MGAYALGLWIFDVEDKMATVGYLSVALVIWLGVAAYCVKDDK
jgi:hypothetical protein